MFNLNAHRGVCKLYFRCVNSSAGRFLTPLEYEIHFPQIIGMAIQHGKRFAGEI